MRCECAYVCAYRVEALDLNEVRRNPPVPILRVTSCVPASKIDFFVVASSYVSYRIGRSVRSCGLKGKRGSCAPRRPRRENIGFFSLRLCRHRLERDLARVAFSSLGSWGGSGLLRKKRKKKTIFHVGHLNASSVPHAKNPHVDTTPVRTLCQSPCKKRHCKERSSSGRQEGGDDRKLF